MNSSKTIGIVGCGTMATGIAIVAARAGFKTRIYDLRPEPLENARKQAAAFLKKSTSIDFDSLTLFGSAIKVIITMSSILLFDMRLSMLLIFVQSYISP